MPSLGLIWRLVAILVAALALIQFTATVLYHADQDDLAAGRFRAPFPEQVIALTRLLDQGAEADRELVLRLANASDMHASITPGPPPLPERGLRLFPLEERIASGLAPRTTPGAIVAWIQDDVRSSGGASRVLGRFARGHVVVAVPLADGRHLLAETAGALTVRLLGLPVGFVAGGLGAVVAILAVLAVFREMRPLSRLASSVGAFSDVLRPVEIPESGAREVRTLIRAINQMQARIASLVKSRTFVVGAISHDLRTYLTRLRLRMELVPEDELREKSIRDVEDMQAIVEEALAFAKGSLAGAPGGREDVVAAVRKVAGELTQAGGAVRLALPPEPILVQASSAALSRIARNLIENAIVHGGSAEVSITRAPEAVELWCEDRGPGIPEAEREAIFEPFYRLEASRSRKHGGVGLGLAIVRQLAEGLGGHVSVEARPGGGSRFRVWLPRLDAAEALRP